MNTSLINETIFQLKTIFLILSDNPCIASSCQGGCYGKECNVFCLNPLNETSSVLEKLRAPRLSSLPPGRSGVVFLDSYRRNPGTHLGERISGEENL